MELNIKSVTNGFILSWDEEIDEEGGKAPIQEVIEGQDEQEEMKRLLEYVAGHFGYHYNKWGDKNLEISFNGKGSKLEDEMNKKDLDSELK